MVKIVKVLQVYSLLFMIIGYGGLMFNEGGEIVSVVMFMVGVGFWLFY